MIYINFRNKRKVQSDNQHTQSKETGVIILEKKKI